MELIAVACLSALIMGCTARKHSVDEFDFITTNTTLQQVIDRVGHFDRVRGSGISYYQWDLAGGSAVLVVQSGHFNRQTKSRDFTFIQTRIAYLCHHRMLRR